MTTPKVIGICGGSGSGKTTIVRKISEMVSDFVFIPQDSYYKSAEYISNANITAFNFDHPDAFDNGLLIEHLDRLRRGEGIGRRIRRKSSRASSSSSRASWSSRTRR
jgi:uridine kinase